MALGLWAALMLGACHPRTRSVPPKPSDGGVPPGDPPTGYVRTAAPNPIPAENQLTGAPAWRDGTSPTGQQLALYASTEAAEAGDAISVQVSTDAAISVTAFVYRTGYYQGAGARLIWTSGAATASPQPACPRDPTTSLVECAWSPTFQFTVGSDWVSGIYLVKVVRADGIRAFTPFVVRDHRAAEILYQPGLNTYQAYNRWGGESLYFDSSGTMPSGRSWKVSYSRPYAEDDGAGYFFFDDYWFIRMLESQGYDVTYGSNLDFTRYTQYLNGIGAFVVAGHDEYWDPAERAQVDAALAGGQTSVLYFGANGSYWRVRVEPSSQGTPDRTVVCYKGDQSDDPIAPGSTGRYRDPPDPWPENALWGIQYESFMVDLGPLAVTDPSHWIFNGTALAAGQLVPNVLGVEFDNIQNNGSSPSGLSVPLQGGLVSGDALPAKAQTVVRSTPSGTLVFAAGSINWSVALNEDPGLYDARVARMTLNVLEHALAFRRPMRDLPEMTGPFPSVPAPNPTWATSVTPVAGVPGSWGRLDGPGSTALFSGPAGLVVLPTGQILVADARNNLIRMIDTDANHTVHTIAGTGALGYVDGPGGQAEFRAPTGLALGPGGVVYVADAVNSCIRKLAGSGTSWTVSTYAGGCWKPGFADGSLTSARFNQPVAVATDPQGNVYVADMFNMRVRMVQASGNVITLLGNGTRSELDASSGTQAEIGDPSALTYDNGYVYVVDPHAGELRAVSTTPPYPTATVAGSHVDFVPFADGSGANARLRPFYGIVTLPDGSLLIADTENHRIRKVVPNGLSDATVTTWAGTGTMGQSLGAANASNICAPTGLALAPDGTVLVSDSFNAVIRRITP